MTQALLPEDLEESTLGNMSASRFAYTYTLPWAMWVDSDRKCWLHPGYPANDSAPRGTATMRVERRPDGYHAWPPPHYTRTPQSEPGYVGGRNIEFIPVVRLHR